MTSSSPPGGPSVTTTPDPNLPKLHMPWAFIGLFAVFTGAGLWWIYWQFYDDLPDPMSVYFNAEGEADSWQQKSVLRFLSLIAIGPVICWTSYSLSAALMVFVGNKGRDPQNADSLSMWHSSLAGIKDPEVRRHVAYHSNRRMIGVLGWYLLFLNTVILWIIYDSYSPTGNSQSIWLGLIAITAATIAFTIYVLRLMKRLRRGEV